MRVVGRVMQYPLIFALGWLFNLVYDTRFVLGFASGWLAHGWIGGLFR